LNILSLLVVAVVALQQVAAVVVVDLELRQVYLFRLVLQSP
jgi:hypothetical protein